MDSELKLETLDLFPNKSDHKINLYKSFPSNSNLSRYPKKNFMNNKYYYNGNKKLLNNKRKDKKRNKNEMPQTPHNTGQYLSHIHQEYEPKKKCSQVEKENDDLECKDINCFEDADEDLDELGNFDFDFINDKKRERLMSLEGKDLHDFLFKPNKNENGENTIVKPCLNFNDNNEDIEEDMELNLRHNKSSQL